MHTALITGASGLLGRQVAKAFHIAGWKAVGTGLTRTHPPSIVKLDILNKDDIERLLDEVKPDVVIHCAANRSPDSCTSEPDAARALNVTASSVLASSTSSRGIFLLYISTDYVFSGRPGEAPYKTTSIPDPPNVYGQTKLDGERAVLDAASKIAGNAKAKRLPVSTVVLRVPVLYGSCDPPESAVNVLMNQVWAAQELKPSDPKIKIDNYAQRYPTNTEDVGRVCVDICQLYLQPSSADKGLPLILQFSSEDKMTKWQICQTFGEILGLPLDGLEPYVPNQEPQDGVKRPYDCHLDTSALKQLGIDVSTVGFTTWWRRELRAFRH
ncbi:NAD(P)-binding protein [Lepidopterella palustris CBS 459.81]|uniref:NAD(P)-binding protein n=1 Tax=Lepidopterella palustris CBS 459.81 TaxID=1314670 RepID=A0A8E2EE53_9PEZI|nr:NAD(P)-binding protein [Lepidopterella palustris CBS 459.81]